MQKQIIIIKGMPGEEYTAFRRRIFNLAETLLEKFIPQQLKLTITTGKPPALKIIPFRKELVAAISAWDMSQSAIPEIKNTKGYTGLYEVDEAIPVAYEKNWEDREETPGVGLLTLFHRKPGIDTETFLDRWHNGHTPLSLELHPLWNYNRNVVVSTSGDKDAPYEGIVEEHFKTRRELLNPLIFFGPPLKVLPHMLMVLKDSRGFIDMKRIETYLVSEYIFKSV